MGIDLAPHPAADSRKQAGQLAQAQLANDHQVHITARAGVPARHRAEHKDHADFRRLERRLQNTHQPIGLEHQRTQVPVRGMVGIGAVIDAVAVFPGNHQADAGEASKFLLDRA